MNPFARWGRDAQNFIVWRASDKSPIDPLHAEPASDYARSDAQNPATWLRYERAYALSVMLGEGYGVGVVLHEGCGLLCVDLDGCLLGGQLSGIAQELIDAARQACQDVYVEVSMSGRGVHIIGPYEGAAPVHATKNTEQHIELYTSRRYIALTGNLLVERGPRVGDLTDFLYATAYKYFRPASSNATPTEWTDSDNPACTFTGSDDDRLAALRRSKSWAAKFGGSAITFDDLWTANADKLATKWPSASDGKPYDASSADQSFFNRLAFGFGNNCEAMLRIAQREDCALRRPKWDREDYLRKTILKACALPKEWKRSRAVVGRPPAVTASTVAALTHEADSGVITVDLPGVPPPPPPAVPAIADVPLLINAKGKYDATLPNLKTILTSTDAACFAYDEFRGRVMLKRGVDWKPVTDTDLIRLRELLERQHNFAAIGKDLMRDAVDLVADFNHFDSGQVWLNSLRWDGVCRVDRFMASHFGAADDEYTQAVGRYMWSGLAGRILSPGCQLDMVIALKSKQGTKKSTGLKLLAPWPDAFNDAVSLQDDDDNFKRLIKGKAVVEIAELAGLSKADITYVKRVITRTTEEWVEKWQTLPTRYDRRCMMFASTNEQEFLPPDETGHRRWLPVDIVELNRDLIKADRDQLWAEGAMIYRAAGIQYAQAEALAATKHRNYEQSDVWEARISEWLVTGPNMPCTRDIAVSEVLEGALRMRPDAMNKASEKRAQSVLRKLGYAPRSVRTGGVLVRRWACSVPTALQT